MSKPKFSLTSDLVTVEPEPINTFLESTPIHLKKMIKPKEEDEKEALNLKISKNIKKDLQIWCVNNKKTMTEVIESSIKEYLNKNKF